MSSHLFCDLNKGSQGSAGTSDASSHDPTDYNIQTDDEDSSHETKQLYTSLVQRSPIWRPQAQPSTPTRPVYYTRYGMDYLKQSGSPFNPIRPRPWTYHLQTPTKASGASDGSSPAGSPLGQVKTPGTSGIATPIQAPESDIQSVPDLTHGLSGSSSSSSPPTPATPGSHYLGHHDLVAATPWADLRYHFRPMQNKMLAPNDDPFDSSRSSDEEDRLKNIDIIEKIQKGFSPNYKGNIRIPRNRSAEIAPEENCSVFVVGLPARLDTHELLSHVRGVGRVYATHINTPEPDRGHYTCAAKIIFFERAAAERFYLKCQLRGFIVRGHPARVLWNRIRTAEQQDYNWRVKSRVLIVSGPREFVNENALTAYFRTKFEFQVDAVITHTKGTDTALVEYRFGSYRCQAEAAKMALSREHGLLVKTWFGRDPCDN